MIWVDIHTLIKVVVMAGQFSGIICKIWWEHWCVAAGCAKKLCWLLTKKHMKRKASPWKVAGTTARHATASKVAKWCDVVLCSMVRPSNLGRSRYYESKSPSRFSLASQEHDCGNSMWKFHENSKRNRWNEVCSRKRALWCRPKTTKGSVSASAGIPSSCGNLNPGPGDPWQSKILRYEVFCF